MSAADRDPVAPSDIPALGLGTWKLTDETCVGAVERAVEAGYRHIDTAQVYDNEAAVGRGLQRAGVDPEAVFLATKVDPANGPYEDCVRSVRASRDRLGRTPDLVYVHWPGEAYDPTETASALDDLVDEGTTRAPGVSNFSVDHLDAYIDAAVHPPVANQFECHPLLPQHDLVAACRERDVRPVAYSPLARGRALEHPTVEEVAAEQDATPAQVCLAWLRAHRIAAIPKSAGAHITENEAATSVILSDDQVARIDDIEERHRCVDPASAWWND